MSYAAIIPFKEGLPQEGIEFRNSWGGAARIWDVLYERYLKDETKPYDSWLSDFHNDEGRRLWDLADNPRLAKFERAVHAFTFDRFHVKRENFKQFADYLRQFIKTHPAKSGHVCHLEAWADLFEKSDAEAIGLHATSVSENPWRHYDSDKDETIPIPLSEGVEVFEWLDKREMEAAAR